MNFGKVHNTKLKLISLVFFLTAIGVVILGVKWQFLDNDQFVAIANERFKDIRIPALRGNILASDGTTLAFSEPRFDVYVWLPELTRAEQRGYQTHEEFLSILAEALKADPEEIDKNLKSGPWWIKIASQIDVETKNYLEYVKVTSSNRPLQGLQFEYVNKRVYPEGRLASQIIGFMGSNALGDFVGTGGLEQFWEGSLKPQEGFDSGEFDSFGNPITIGRNSPLEPKPGMTIQTTINKNLQSILEKNLKIGLNEYQAESATGIILDPKTGAILAMANMPDYNPNEYFLETNASVFGNLAISVPYEIGSVGKVLTIAAALDLETLEPYSKLLPDGHQGCEIISPSPPADASCDKITDKFDCICTYNRQPINRLITPASALIDSDNIGFRHIALTMSYDELRTYLYKFGIGSSTKVELSGESTGLLKESEYWNYADQAVYSYGHGYQATPLQTISAIATVANEGMRMQPYLVQKVTDSEGRTTIFNPRVVDQVIKPVTAQAVSDIMHQVYLGNIPERQYKDLADYYIGLKSGTALIPNKDRAGYSSKINATYIGYDASPSRTFVLLIKLEDPKVGDLSFYNARIVWLNTFMDIKDYLGVKKYAR